MITERRAFTEEELGGLSLVELDQIMDMCYDWYMACDKDELPLATEMLHLIKRVFYATPGHLEFMMERRTRQFEAITTGMVSGQIVSTADVLKVLKEVK